MNRLTRAFSRLKPRWFSERKAIILLVLLVAGIAFGVGAHAQSGLLEYGTQTINMLMGILGLVLSAIAWGLGKLIIAVIGLIIIPILGYNEFGSSNVVSIGWALVRDVVNMFVIVVLLVIAVQTMLGVGRIDWRQQLPMFFIAIIAVNFSKTITLFVIDIGQVVMFTFVNALTDIAAGNFIQLFQIDAAFNLSDTPEFIEEIGNSGGYNAVGFLATSYLTVALLGMVLGVLLLMALVFIYRIVVLWVLIILSPIAFFARGIGNTLSVGNQYADWWKRLVGATALGPILAFFLWLALAAASSGSIASSEGFDGEPSSDAGSASGLYTEIFEPDKLLSVFIAMVLITVGFQAASAQAQALGGPAAQLISGQTGQRLLKGAVAAPAAVGYVGARAGVRGTKRAVRAGAGELETRYGLVSGAADRLARVVAPSAALGGPVGRAIAAPFFQAQKAAASFREGELAKAKGRTDEYSETQRFAEYDAIRLKQAPGAGRYGDRAVLQSKLATDKSEQKAYKKYLQTQLGLGDSDEDKAKLDTAYGAAIGEALKNTEASKNELFADDEKGKANLFKARSRNLHLYEPDDPERKKKIRDHIFDDDFKVSQLSADSVRDEDVQAALQEKVMGSYTDTKTGQRVDVSAWDYVKRGQSGTSADARDAANDVDKDLVRNFDAASASEISDRLRDGVMKVENVNVDNLTGKNSDAVLEGLAGAASSGVDLRALPEDVRLQAESMFDSKMDGASPADEARYRRALYSMDRSVEDLGVDPATGNLRAGASAGARIAFEQEFNVNPASAGAFSDQISAAGAAGNDITQMIADQVGESQINQLVEQFSNEASETIRAELANSMDAIQKAVETEFNKAEAKSDRKKALEKRNNRIKRVMGFMSE